MIENNSVCDDFINLLIDTRHKVVSIRNTAKLTGDTDSAGKEIELLFRDFDEKFYDIQHEFSCHEEDSDE